MIQIDVANHLATFVVSILTILGFITAIVAMFIRVESKVNHLKEDYEKYKANEQVKEGMIWTKIDTMQSSLQSSINHTLQALGRVEGKLEIKKD